MKKFFVLLAIVTLLLPSCQKINDRIDGLEDRIDQIEGTQIATINQQIEAINSTLPQLRETDTELKEYIKSLQTTATNLQEQITNTSDDIDELEDALDQAIADAEASNDALKTELVAQLNAAKADILAQLESTKTTLEAELNQINSTIATLQAKDIELEGKITTLEEYVNTELQNTEDWATATFATLEQYNTIVEDIATIKTQIEALNTSLTNLEERLNTKIATDIATAVEGLQSELATKVTEITTAYTDAISTAKEEVAAAYTEAIATAITDLESSMKEWVNEQLTGYYTIAEIDAQIEALRELYRETGHEQLAEDIESLEGVLQDMKEELTEAYQKAIEDAINTNNGVIDGKIAEEVATINSRIDNEIAALNNRLNNIEDRLCNIEKYIDNIVNNIYSISYIPRYADGIVHIDVENQFAELDFIVTPKSAVKPLRDLWNSILSAKVSYAVTRSVDFTNLVISECEVDEVYGVITVRVLCDTLSQDFYNEQCVGNLYIEASSEYSSITSNYVRIEGIGNMVKFKDKNIESVCLNLWDMNNDGKLSYIEASAISSLEGINKCTGIYGGSTYQNKAIYANPTIYYFDEFKYFTGIKNIPHIAFSNWCNLSSITLPDNIEIIDNGEYLEVDDISVISGHLNYFDGTYTYHGAFSNTSLTEIFLPASITEIGSYAFYGSTLLSNIYCKATTPPSLGTKVFGNIADSYTIYVPTSSLRAYLTSPDWEPYADNIEPYDFDNDTPVE